MIVRLFSAVRRKKFLPSLGCEDAAFTVTDNLYLLLKRATGTRLVPASTKPVSPSPEPRVEADASREHARKTDRVCG